MDSNKQSLVIESGGAMGFFNSNTTISNSIDYGIKAYFGKIWNYGTMSISDNNDGDYAVLIDRSGAYLANMTITGGTGNDPLLGIYNSYSTVIENSSIKNHSGNLLNINRSVVEFEGENHVLSTQVILQLILEVKQHLMERTMKIVQLYHYLEVKVQLKML